MWTFSSLLILAIKYHFWCNTAFYFAIKLHRKHQVCSITKRYFSTQSDWLKYRLRRGNSVFYTKINTIKAYLLIYFFIEFSRINDFHSLLEKSRECNLIIQLMLLWCKLYATFLRNEMIIRNDNNSSTFNIREMKIHFSEIPSRCDIFHRYQNRVKWKITANGY